MLLISIDTVVGIPRFKINRETGVFVIFS